MARQGQELKYLQTPSQNQPGGYLAAENIEVLTKITKKNRDILSPNGVPQMFIGYAEYVMSIEFCIGSSRN